MFAAGATGLAVHHDRADQHTRLTDIKVGRRLRQIDKDKVVSLGASIKHSGLLHPIILRDNLSLVAGAKIRGLPTS